ncbi:MAG: ATP-dependent DNA helicase [Ornithinimicrobium sp.]
MAADLDALLASAVKAVDGTTRPGQVQMAHAVRDAVEDEQHLVVQAGTGTGKSLAYLVPAIAHAMATGKPVVVATATLALQSQIVDRDLPRICAALRPLLGREPSFALVKGRSNYLCKHKTVGGFPDEDAQSLLSVGEVDTERSAWGAEVGRLREWAEVTASGDRDELVPGVSNRAWRQVSVSARECLGQKCPLAAECHVEVARATARDVDVVVTNHAFMAIDAFEGRHLLPEHDLLVIDEAHELTDRVTSTVTAEMSAASVTASARKAARHGAVDDLTDAADELGIQLEALPDGRLGHGLPEPLVRSLTAIRDAARGLQSEISSSSDGGAEGARQAARSAVAEGFESSERLLAERELDVAWVARDPRGQPVLRVAPMSVSTMVREKVLADRTVVMTSATLELGGSFDAVAGTVGLRGPDAPDYTGLDVGSPFDYPRQAIVYVARHLPPLGREGAGPAVFEEIEALVRAAGGRTLGLFSSRRAAETAAEQMRDRLSDTDIEVLCQGEDQTPTLVREFAARASTCLFGTMSLWQGVDVPGSACQLVLIDRIPFPRPDDPLSSARTEAIGRMGGNGFMAVSATHAALKLAQGAGRLVRRQDDRGVVALLDSRMVTKSYAGFLQRSLPPFWPTTDRELVLSALTRLDAEAPDVLPVRATSTSAAVSAPPVARSPRTAVTGGHAWTKEQDDELREGIEAGVPTEALAEHLELTPDLVTSRMNQLELKAFTP